MRQLYEKRPILHSAWKQFENEKVTDITQYPPGIPETSLLHYRPDIDGIRAMAVISVVLFHAGVPGFSGGYVGVDVFFVISGYLITRFLRDDYSTGRFSLIRFYERRARRILPALILVIAAATGVGYFMLMPIEYIDFSRSAFAATVFGANFWFLTVAGDYFSADAEFMPLLHTWSLSVEEQFYVVFPIVLWIVLRRGRVFAASVLAFLTILSLMLSVSVLPNRPDAAFYLSHLRAWELGIGALLAMVAQSWLISRPLREIVAAAGMLAIVISVALYDNHTPFPGIAALLPCVGTAALIHAGCSGASFIGRVLSWRPLVFVGLISYSLYLWHWPVLAFLRLRLGQIDLPPGVAATAVLTAAGLAVVSWKYVELPFRRNAGTSGGKRGIFRLSAAAMCGVLLVATLIRESEGLPDRVPRNVQVAYEAARDTNPLRARCFNQLPRNGLCRFPEDSDADEKPTILVWGDSHADAIMPGVSEAAGQLGVVGVFVGKRACAPLLGVKRAKEQLGRNCPGFNDRVIEYLELNEEITVVVLAARWALAAEAERAPGERGDPAYLVSTTRPREGDRAIGRNFELYREGVNATVDTIRSMGRDVILLGNVPEIGWNVPRQSINHARWGDPLPDAPSFDDVMERQGRADRVLAGLAERSGVHFVPIAARLCKPICTTHLDDRPVYFDDDHLTRFGSIRLIAPLVLESLQSVLSR